jgi:4-hydroxy-4-methyl-2-oxoglutarate aldolase
MSPLGENSMSPLGEKMSQIRLVDALGKFSTATLYEAAGKRGDMGPKIRPIVPRVKLAGIALTIRVWPGDTLAVLRAIDRALPGSVIVVDAGEVGSAAVWGGTSSMASAVRGIRGCVTNGCVRDVDEIVELQFPVYAAGISPRGTMKNHPGWTGIPISVCGVSVNMGDFVIGDTDGVLVISAADAEDVLERARTQRAKEADRDARVKAGEPLAKLLDLPAE